MFIIYIKFKKWMHLNTLYFKKTNNIDLIISRNEITMDVSYTNIEYNVYIF